MVQQRKARERFKTKDEAEKKEKRRDNAGVNNQVC